MIDATLHIISGIENCLSNANYDGTSFPVLDVLPQSRSFNYIWIKGISATDDGTKDKEIQNIKIDIEVIKSGTAQKGNLTAVTEIANQVIKSLKNISVNNYFIAISPRLINYSFVDEIVNAENTQIIIDRKLLSFEMLIQKS